MINKMRLLKKKQKVKKDFDELEIALKYHNDEPVIKELTRESKPGLRKYAGVGDMPRVLNGLGIAIVSTSKGLITDKEARKQNIGGEVICFVD